jgi:hypothetical protein
MPTGLSSSEALATVREHLRVLLESSVESGAIGVGSSEAS